MDNKYFDLDINKYRNTSKLLTILGDTDHVKYLKYENTTLSILEIDDYNHHKLLEILQYAKNITHISIQTIQFNNLNYLPPYLQYLSIWSHNKITYLPNSLTELWHFSMVNANYKFAMDKLPINVNKIRLYDDNVCINLPIYLKYLLIMDCLYKYYRYSSHFVNIYLYNFDEMNYILIQSALK